MLWTGYRPAIKIGPKGALGSHEIRPLHSAPSLGKSIEISIMYVEKYPPKMCGIALYSHAYLHGEFLVIVFILPNFTSDARFFGFSI